MAHMCRLTTGAVASCAGWVGVIVATATNDWVRTCDYTINTCIRMEELGARGLWAKCVISPALYHCVALNQILTLPAYVQTARALMICACLLGLPALLLVLVSMPCVKLVNDTMSIKYHRAIVGGTIILLIAVFGIVSTVWFPIGAYQEEGLLEFGFSLYAGWVGSGLCLLGGSVILCCYSTDPGTQRRENSYYYCRQGGTATPLDPPANHSKCERV